VRGYRERTGHGPSWGELRRHPAGAQQVMSSIESAPATIPATRAATLMPR